MSAPRAETRNPLAIAGSIRECAERLQARDAEPSYSVDRLVELAAELERALTIQQFQKSLDLLEAVKRIVYEDEAGEITGGAIEDCKQAIEKAEAESCDQK